MAPRRSAFQGATPPTPQSSILMPGGGRPAGGSMLLSDVRAGLGLGGYPQRR
jgi:hypothetical protein